MYVSILRMDFREILQQRYRPQQAGLDHTLPWLAVWEFLRSEIIDDEGTTSDRKPTNRSNRFEVANKVNSLLSESEATYVDRFGALLPKQLTNTCRKLGLNSLSSQLKAS